MAERENDALRRIQQTLQEDKRRQELKSLHEEETRIQLRNLADQKEAVYQIEVELTRPEAQESVNQIIQPWFSNLVSSGTYAELLGWSKAHNNNIRLSDEIFYYWPRSLQTPENRPYYSTAKLAIKSHSVQNIQRLIQSRSSDHEEDVWRSSFKLDGWGHVNIRREPGFGTGGGFMFVAGSYEIPVGTHNIASSFERISPEVWLEFGKQIESGKAWEAIEQSLRGVKPQQSWEWRKEGIQDYLRNRQWH